jgi:thymidylate synthase
MKQYIDALKHVLENGTGEDSRAGDVVRTFGYQMRFNLQEGFPAVTTKKLAWKSVVSELLWFIEGSGDERRLAEILHGTRDASKKTIWTANAEADYWKPKAKYEGDLGRVYGVQWRDWRGIDQFANLLDNLKKDPYSRRHILSAWNVDEIDNMALPPCHTFSQFFVSKGKLSCQLYQRSADMFLGVPFNIASYSLLTHIMAKELDLGVGDFVHTFGDLHIYKDHLAVVEEQIKRVPQGLPKLEINTSKNINEYTLEDFVLTDYSPMPSLKAKMAV